MRVPVLLFLFCIGTGCESSLPTREQPAGDCVKESDCSASGQACIANQCVPCTAHTDCLGQVCDTYGDLGGVGKCIAADQIIYVDSSDKNASVCFTRHDQPTGSQALPFCDIAAAVTKLMATPGKLIRVLASPESYDIIPVDPAMGPVVLIGPGQFGAGKTASLTGNSGGGKLQVGMGASLVLDGFSTLWDGIAAEPNSKVTIRRSTLGYMNRGAQFGSGSTVTLDRDRIFMGTLGLGFSASTVSITNSFVTGSTVDSLAGLLNFTGGSGVFQFNTVAFNNPVGGSAAALVSCSGSSTVTFKNSIFVQNGGSRQLVQSCVTAPQSLVVGTTDSTAGQVQREPVFVDPMAFDLRLNAQDATNIQFVIDKAVGVDPKTDKYVDHDYYGTPRPSGAGYDIGAFEVVSP